MTCERWVNVDVPVRSALTKASLAEMKAGAMPQLTILEVGFIEAGFHEGADAAQGHLQASSVTKTVKRIRSHVQAPLAMFKLSSPRITSEWGWLI